MRKDIDPVEHHVVSSWGFTHHGAAVDAVGYEVLGDKITFSDHVLYVASPVRKGLAEEPGCLTHTVWPIRGAGQRRVMVDEPWVEVAIDSRQVPVGEQGSDELLDNLLVMCAGHDAIVGWSRPLHHPSKVGCFLTPMRRRMGGVEESRAVARRSDDLVRRCYSGLGATAFQTEVVRAIHALLPVDAVFLAAADPGTLLFTSIFAEEPLVGVADQFLDNEFGQDDVNKFQSLATGTRHVATLDSASRGDRSASARYRDIMAPLGLGDELRAALVTTSGCWGYLCLHRAESPYGFTPAEVRLIGRLAASLGNGFRLGLAGQGIEGSAAIAPGIVVLHPDCFKSAGSMH
jgi:hypothetical protein